MVTLREKALVVRVKLSGWTANKKDREETENVRARNNVSQGTVRVSKSLLPGAARLDNIRNCAADLTKYVRKNSLPWDRGSYIIQAERYMPFVEQTNRLKARWERAVEDFVQEYPSLVAQARNDLGSLFNEKDYPDDIEDIKSKFSCDINFRPVESGDDWRVTLNEDDVKTLRESTEKAVKEQVGEAMKDVWRRVHDVVNNACKVLSNPNGRVHETLIGGAQELVEILPSLNLTEDKDLERMGETIKNLLACQDPAQLRKDKQYRAHVAKDLKNVKNDLDNMLGFFTQ